MSNFELYSIAVFFGIISFLTEVNSHGMMLDPVSRSSRWRVDRSARANYDDNALFCGGFSNMWGKNGGKCGLCGDDYSIATPRPNEIGGTYGQGVIVKNYVNQVLANIGVRITANHLGLFYFNICNLDEFGKESEACFNKYRIQFTDGSEKMYIGSRTGWVNSTIVLPTGLNCKHCVLRWNYQGGNNWGFCEDGSGALGCGAQENFKGCADISISAAGSRVRPSVPEVEIPENEDTAKSETDDDDTPVVPVDEA